MTRKKLSVQEDSVFRLGRKYLASLLDQKLLPGNGRGKKMTVS
jgi:hypothetical protein